MITRCYVFADASENKEASRVYQCETEQDTCDAILDLVRAGHAWDNIRAVDIEATTTVTVGFEPTSLEKHLGAPRG